MYGLIHIIGNGGGTHRCWRGGGCGGCVTVKCVVAAGTFEGPTGLIIVVFCGSLVVGGGCAPVHVKHKHMSSKSFFGFTSFNHDRHSEKNRSPLSAGSFSAVGKGIVFIPAATAKVLM